MLRIVIVLGMIVSSVPATFAQDCNARAASNPPRPIVFPCPEDEAWCIEGETIEPDTSAATREIEKALGSTGADSWDVFGSDLTAGSSAGRDATASMHYENGLAGCTDEILEAIPFPRM